MQTMAAACVRRRRGITGRLPQARPLRRQQPLRQAMVTRVRARDTPARAAAAPQRTMSQFLTLSMGGNSSGGEL